MPTNGADRDEVDVAGAAEGARQSGRPRRAAEATGSWRALPDRNRALSRRALAVIAVAAFVLGTAELVEVGVLPLVAQDLSIGMGSAGLLVTSYAAGISIGGPVLAALTLRIQRTRLLQLSLAAYVIGNVVVVVAAGFGAVLLARLTTGALHGLFIGAAFTVATSLVPREQMGRAIAAVSL